MRNHSISRFTTLPCLLFATAANAATPAPITDVLLFPGGATISRTVQVGPGMTQAVIEGLPSGFDMQTLRAEAGAGIHVGEIVSADAAKTQAVNPAEASLEARITALRDQRAVLHTEEQSARLVIDYLARLGGSNEAQDARRSTPVDGKALTGLATAMSTEASKAYARIQHVTIAKRDLDKKIDAAQRDLARLRTGAMDTRTLTINLAAERAGTLTVSYQVNNAGWKPAYRASLNSETSKLELERQAIISQKTGEDWTNVRLTLSTSQPRRTTSGGDPHPWLLSWQRTDPRSSFDSVAESMPAPAAPAVGVLGLNNSVRAKREAEQTEAGTAPEPEEADYVPPTFETQAMFATEFQVPARTSLPADGREVSVALAKETLAVKQYLQATPRHDAAVYVTAEADKPQGDWPAGAIQLFRDGSYVGSNDWNPQAKDHLVLGFGRDAQMHVSVVPVKGDSGSAGLFGSRDRKKIATVFALTNHHRRPVKLLVVEPSPVSTSDEVRVRTAFEPKPTHETWEDKRGVMAWELNLAPGETSKITTDYEIDFPAEGNLQGLQ